MQTAALFAIAGRDILGPAQADDTATEPVGQQRALLVQKFRD